MSTCPGVYQLTFFISSQLARDLLHPTPEEQKRRHKKKRLVQSPNSYFMDVKCPGCYKITTVFSHAQTVVLCVGCSTVLCQPTGGKARLTEDIYRTLDASSALLANGVERPHMAAILLQAARNAQSPLLPLKERKDALSDENSTSVPALAMLGDWYQTLDKQHCPEQTEQEYTKGENLPRSEGGED
ncbi:40S ribosomal protein S27 [Merluccius polli]|uniref:40S ribosomal protein S27 n=1 Tax=Merluccius polli TaxID=89951 RepID=A0AA47P040_MERPO|nr:40S ribosomal protein S27 [Merluccius polli]